MNRIDHEDHVQILATLTAPDDSHGRTLVFGGTATALYMPGHTGVGHAEQPYATKVGKWRQVSKEAVSPAVQVIRQLVPLLGVFDPQRRCSVGYWGTSPQTNYSQVIGDLNSHDAASKRLDNPFVGTSRYLGPALEEAASTVRQRVQNGEPIGAFFPVFGIGGPDIEDHDDVVEFAHELAINTAGSGFPRTTIVLAAYGNDVDVKQLQQLQREATPRNFKGPRLFHILRVPTVMDLPAALSKFFMSDDARRFNFGTHIERADNNRPLKASPVFTPPILQFRAPFNTPLVLKAGGHAIPFQFDSDRT